MALYNLSAGDQGGSQKVTTPRSHEKMSLLSSKARVQLPWVKVQIGNYSFGTTQSKEISANTFEVEYPNYVKNLNIKKINGQVNKYSLTLEYPITQTDDPNFFEKVFSSVSTTREITFSYGDMSMQNYIYKDEKAIITSVSQSFNLQASSITYTVQAISGAALKTDGSTSFPAPAQPVKPSTLIKKTIKENASLRNVFTGMYEGNSVSHLEKFIASDDQAVKLESKINISVLDYISYLASCMIPIGTDPKGGVSTDIYVLTIHDETYYENSFGESYNGLADINGPYFQVKRTSYLTEQSDAYTIDIGYNTSTIVRDFQIDHNENYSLYYDYQGKLNPKKYVRKIDNDGKWQEIYAPAELTKKQSFEAEPDDVTWWTKITKYPITARITIQGLLRPAILMTYVRLNVIFPGGHKHIASGLYIVTEQFDNINSGGYTTQLGLTKISGDDNITFKTE